jgi:transposase
MFMCMGKETVAKFLEGYFGKRGARTIIALVLMVFGLTHTEIQKNHGTALSTLRRYRNMLNDGNIEVLFEVSERKRERSKLDDYENEILTDFNNNPPKTLREAQSRIEGLTGLKRSLHRLRVWLLKRGFNQGQ